MLLCPAPATTMSNRSSLDACWPMENGVAASGASAAAFTNPRLLILLMGNASPKLSVTLSSLRLPRYWSRNLSASPLLHSAPVHRSRIHRDVLSLLFDTNQQSASGVAPSPPRDASHPIAPGSIRLRDNSHASCAGSCVRDRAGS